MTAVDVGHGQLRRAAAGRSPGEAAGADRLQDAVAERRSRDRSTSSPSTSASWPPAACCAGWRSGCGRGAQGVVLVKPQFELPRHQVKGGDVSAPALRAQGVAELPQQGGAAGLPGAPGDRLAGGGRGGHGGDAGAPGAGGAIGGAAGAWARSGPRAHGAAPAVERRRERWFAVAAPGLEPVVRGGGGPAAGGGEACGRSRAGWSWPGDLEMGMAANLRLRAATRVLLRAGEVKAREFSKLRRLVAKLPWERWCRPPRRCGRCGCRPAPAAAASTTPARWPRPCWRGWAIA